VTGSKPGMHNPESKEKSLSISGRILMELMRAVHDKGASFRFRATGSSMTPAIRNNDFITISPLKGIMPSPGEVVAFRHPANNRLVLHRVAKIKKNSFVIRADRQQVVDAVITDKNIIGVVTRVERDGQAFFLPDRFHQPIRTKTFFQVYLIYINGRRYYRAIRAFVRKQLTRFF
jgi:hypothetical protein